MLDGIREITEETMTAAHKAGMAYWYRNRPSDDVTIAGLISLAQSCGWHSEEAISWAAGYFGAKRRDGGSSL